jgi:uncharacterized protein involved in exopolysaccharide biosynthesis
MNDGTSDSGRTASRAPARELDLFDLVAFVWTRKLLAIVVAVIVFIPLAFLAFLAIKPSYEATSRLLVIQDEEDLTPGAAGSGGAFTLDQVMVSEAEILNSDAVRRLALEQRGGLVSPVQLAALRDGFRVSRAPNSSILVANFEGAQPDVAANTLNAIIDAYLAYRVELLIGGPNGAIDERLAAAEAEAARAEAALRDFLATHDISDFATERDAVLSRISDLQARVLSARAEAQSARGFARSLATRLANIPETIELYVENSVTGQLLDLQVRREELLARYQPGAPPVQAVEREIAALQAFINAGGAEGQGQRRTGANPIWQTLESERLQQESFASSQAQLADALDAQLAATRQEADRLRALAPEHDRLLRAVQARADAAQRLSVQAADASARRNAPAGAADAVRVVERATPPAEASSLLKPALAAAFVFACGLGVVSALFAGYFDHARRPPSRPRPDPQPSRAPAQRRSRSSSPPSDAAPPPRRELPVLARVPNWS